jgi:hypothetical protein
VQFVDFVIAAEVATVVFEVVASDELVEAVVFEVAEVEADVETLVGNIPELHPTQLNILD